MISEKRVLRVLIILFIAIAVCPAVETMAQVPVTKSEQRVVIKGVSYYIHTVEKGQTSFSIARAYSITVERLHSENPEALYGLKEGQVLKIPVVEPAVTREPEKDLSKFIYHTVAPGETIFSLSRRYDVPQTSILEANPGVDPADIPVGSELAIPRKDFKAPVVSIAPVQETYTNYVVREGETLSSISRRFGLSVRELRRANAGLIFVRAGDIVKLPGRFDTGSEDKQVEIPADTIDVSHVEVTDTLPEIVIPASYTDISDLRGSIEIAVLLPLFLPENAARTEIDSVNPQRPRIKEKPFSWIYPQTVTFLEMYEGMLVAADEMRSAGMDVRIHTFDTRADSSVVEDIINSGRLRGMDLILGPVFSYNLEKVVAYCDRHSIPVVSPVPLRNNGILYDHPYLFVANPSLTTIQESLALSVGSYFDKNLVFIYSDTSMTENESAPFRNMILRELSYRTDPGSVNFKQLLYRSWSSSSTDTLNRISHTLSPSALNVVILGTENEAAISETLMNLHGLHKKHQMLVYGYPSVRNLEYNIDLSYLFDLNINIYSPFYVDYEREMVLGFLERFRNTYRAEPSEDSFAWIGYDIMRYFASGLSVHGRRFVDNPSIHNPELLHSKFDFRRNSDREGFENRGLFHLRYSNEMRIEVVTDFPSSLTNQAIPGR